jgi:hypothetical protein
MVKLLLFSLLIIVFGAGHAMAADRTPAGYVMEMSLAGEDATAKTVIVRDGGEIAAKLMMPVFDGDIVFLRDAASRLGLEMGDGKAVQVGGSVMRFTVRGELNTGDSTWGIIAAIGSVFAGEDEPAPENMVSKGGTLKMPMAIRGTNLVLKGRRTLWLGWEGGKAPFSINLAAVGGETELDTGISGNGAEIALPDDANDKLTLVVRDAEQQKVQVKLRFAGALPEGGPPETASTTGNLALAAWLTGQDDGAWSIEAAQRLRDIQTDASSLLIDKIRTGWRFSAAGP